MYRLLALLIVGLWLLPLPAPAQQAIRNRIQQRLNEASTYFNHGDYYMGVARINEACSILKTAPGAMPDSNYIQIATKTVDDLDAKIKDAKAQGNTDATNKIVSALQQLVTSLTNWEPQNPRWHYERGMVLKTMSALRNDQYQGDLSSAIQEFDAALAISGGGPYRASAQEMRNACQQTLQKRQSEIANFRRKIVRPKGTGRSSGGGSGQVYFCGRCGRQIASPAGSCPICDY
jgi:tetratricopeptide (TPR) repeat protein